MSDDDELEIETRLVPGLLANTDQVRPVSADLLMCVQEKVDADHEAGKEPDPTVSAISALHGKCEIEEIHAVVLRLTALANLIVHGEGKAWTINIDGKDYTLIHEALFRAAATAPLTVTKIIGDMRFGPEILESALQNADPSGSA